MRVALSNAQRVREIVNGAVEDSQFNVPGTGALRASNDAGLGVGWSGGSYNFKTAVVKTSFADVLTKGRTERFVVLLSGVARA